jgi:hypothetical protein
MTRPLHSVRSRPRTRRIPASYALASPLAYRRRRARALFLPRTTQQVERPSVAREIARAALALGGLAAWSGLVLLLGS